MKSPTFGYIEGSTPVHRLDALSKLALVILVSVFAFVVDDPRVVAAQLVVLIGLAVLGRPSGAPLVRPLVILAVLAALLVIFQVLNSHTGVLVTHVGPIEVYSGGLAKGLLYSLRVATLMLSSFLFVRTTDPRKLVVGLVYLGIPYRFAWMIFVSLTSLSMFRSEFEVAREAQLVRGLPPAQSAIHRQLSLWRRYAQSMLVIGLRRVEVVSVAMDIRGFAASPTRTFTDPFVWSVTGIVLAGAWLAAIVTAAVL